MAPGPNVLLLHSILRNSSNGIYGSVEVSDGNLDHVPPDLGSDPPAPPPHLGTTFGDHDAASVLSPPADDEGYVGPDWKRALFPDASSGTPEPTMDSVTTSPPATTVPQGANTFASTVASLINSTLASVFEPDTTAEEYSRTLSSSPPPPPPSTSTFEAGQQNLTSSTLMKVICVNDATLEVTTPSGRLPTSIEPTNLAEIPAKEVIIVVLMLSLWIYSIVLTKKAWYRLLKE